MSILLYYAILSSLVTMAGWIAYKTCFTGSRSHAVNRMALLSVMAVSLLAVPYVMAVTSDWSFGSPSSASPANGNIKVVDSFNIIKWDKSILKALTYVYLAGCLVILLRTIANIVKIRLTIRRGSGRTVDGCDVVVTDDADMAPCSWWNHIIVRDTDLEDNADMILAHEKQHIYHRHGLDLILAQALGIFQWFNPFALLLIRELKAVHEFQADNGVIDSGIDAKSYQMLLVRRAVGVKALGMMHGLNNSKIGRRISMMCSDSANSGSSLPRLISMTIFVAGCLAIFAMPSVNNALRTTGDFLRINEEAVVVNDLKARLFVNGKPVSQEELEKISPDRIKAVTVKKGLDDHPEGALYIDLKD